MGQDRAIDSDVHGHWRAWQVRSAKHERLVRLRLMIALPVIAAVIGVGAYALLVR
jgi:hypothetical protein